MKPTPVATLIAGIVGALICFVFAGIAYHLAFPVSPAVLEGLIIGGAASLGVGTWGALKTPTKGEGQ